MKKILFSMLFCAVMLNGQSQEEGWTLSAGKVDKYTGIVTANGRIGILPEDKPFETKSIILNNGYDKESPLGVSRILLGMNFAKLALEIDGELIDENNVSDWKQTLNMKTAGFTTSFIFKDKAKVSYTIYALRNIQYSGYIDISVEPLKDISLKATGIIETPDEYHSPNSTFRVLQD